MRIYKAEFIFLLFFFSSYLSVKAVLPTPADSTVLTDPCYLTGEISLVYDPTPGMQVLSGPLDSINTSSYLSINNTVNISGVVDSISDDVCFNYVSTVIPNCAFIRSKEDSSSHLEIVRVAVHSFKSFYEEENPMTRVLDSSWIYVPITSGVKVSDSIYIKDYSVLLKNVYRCAPYTRPSIIVAGEFSIFPSEVEGTTSIKKNAPASERARKGHNRDAAGKALNACNARKAKF